MRHRPVPWCAPCSHRRDRISRTPPSPLSYAATAWRDTRHATRGPAPGPRAFGPRCSDRDVTVAIPCPSAPVWRRFSRRNHKGDGAESATARVFRSTATGIEGATGVFQDCRLRPLGHSSDTNDHRYLRPRRRGRQPPLGCCLRHLREYRSHVDVRFDKVDAGFDKVDGRFDKVDVRLVKVEARLSGVEGVARTTLTEVVALARRLEHIETGLRVAERRAAFEEKFAELERRGRS